MLQSQKNRQLKTYEENKIQRISRTRTLIQLGGLVAKSGLCETLQIKMGDDMQANKTNLDKASTLLGAMVLINNMITERGAKFLDELFLLGDPYLK